MRADRRILLLAVAVFVGFFLDLGTPPLFDRDEGAFSEATREMIENRDFVSPTLNFEPRFDKPILIYWMQLPWVLTLGVNEWGFRFASALAAAVWLIALVAFARPRLGRDDALFAGVLMATTLGTMVLARAAIADALLNLWLALAFFDMWRWIERPRRATLWRVFLWMGLGALTKGPVALVVPGGASLVYFLSKRDPKTWLRCVFDPVGLSIFVAVVAPWYTAQFLREGMDFYHGFFMRHNVDRFSGTLEGHGGGFLYYVPVVLLVLLPHTSIFLNSLRRVREVRTDDLARFLWGWFAFVFVFFSLSGTKLPHYVLLAATPMVLLMARERERMPARAAMVVAPVILWAVVLAVPRVVDAIGARVEDRYFQAVLTEAPRVFDTAYDVVAVVGLVGVALVALLWRGPRWHAAMAMGLLQAFLLVRFVVPSFGELLQEPVKEASLLAREIGAPTVRYAVDHPSVSVYRRAATARRAPESGELAVTERHELEDLLEDGKGPVEVLYERGGIILVRRLPATPTDAPTPDADPDPNGADATPMPGRSGSPGSLRR